MKQFLTTLLILGSLIFTATGCDKAKKEKTIREFKEKSVELSIYGTKLAQAFGKAFDEGVITKTQLNNLNRGMDAYIFAVGVYRQGVSLADEYIKKGEEVPKNIFNQIDMILSQQVVQAFLAITVQIGLMSVQQTTEIKLVIESIKLAILALKSMFAEARNNLKEINDGRLAKNYSVRQAYS